ncbi:MAG: ATP-binding protein [Planctomycetes bacterium]|nr:ATP-binding protein [Planctomycetota bacterium]
MDISRAMMDHSTSINLSEEFPRVLLVGYTWAEYSGWWRMMERIGCLLAEVGTREEAAARIKKQKPAYVIVFPEASTWSRDLVEDLVALKRPPGVLLVGSHMEFQTLAGISLPVVAVPQALTAEGLTGCLRTLTELRDDLLLAKAEEGLTRRSRRLVFEQSPIPMVVVGEDAKIVEANAALTNACGGETQGGLAGQSVERILLKPELIDNFFAEVDASGKVNPQRVTVRDSQGGTRYIDLNASPISSRHGKALLIVWQDSTARIQETLNREMRGRLDSLSRLAGGVAHYLNNLLTPMQGYAEILRDALSSEDDIDDNARSLLAEHSEVILDNSRKAAEIISYLVMYAKSGKAKPVIVAPGMLLLEILKCCEDCPEDIVVAHHVDSDAQIPLDRDMFEKAIRHVISNAMEAMPGGGTLTISGNIVSLGAEDAKRLEATPEDYYMISIEDSGKGMTEAEQQRVFEPFFSTKQIGQGVGLGLSMVYGIVRSHGGSIEISSAPDHGTRVDIYFPVMRNTKIEAQAEGVYSPGSFFR